MPSKRNKKKGRARRKNPPVPPQQPPPPPPSPVPPPPQPQPQPPDGDERPEHPPARLEKISKRIGRKLKKASPVEDSQYTEMMRSISTKERNRSNEDLPPALRKVAKDFVQEISKSYHDMIKTRHAPKWCKKIGMAREAMDRCEWDESERLTTEVLVNIRRVDIKFIRENISWFPSTVGVDIEDCRPFPYCPPQFHALVCRAETRVRLEQYAASIQDWTDALHFLEYRCWSIGSSSDSMSLRQYQVGLFCSRSQAYERLFRELGTSDLIEKSVEDAKTALAAIDNNDENQENEFYFVQCYLVNLLAEQKLLQQQQRPLFNPEEQWKLESKLGIGRHAAGVYFCYHCLKPGYSPARPSCAGVKLLMCSRCKQCWFCSRECHRAAWNNCHKHECSKTLQRVLIMPEALELQSDSLITNVGDTSDSAVIPYPCAKDEDTGRFFECLSNSDVYLESELHLIPPAHLAFEHKMEAKEAEFSSQP